MRKNKLLAVAVSVILSAIFVSCGSSSTANSSDKAANSEKESSVAEVASTVEEAAAIETTESSEESTDSSNVSIGFANNVLTTEKYTVTITDYKVIPDGEKGNEYSEKPVIAFWYDVNNISDDDLDPSSAWIMVMTAIQDNDPNRVNELEMASLPDAQFLDSQMEKIKVGGTVSNAVAYELDDEETPVTLKAAEVIGDEYGEQTFEIK